MRPKKYTNLWHKNKSLEKCIILCAFSRIRIVGSALGPVICLDRRSVQRMGDWEHSALNGRYVIYEWNVYIYIYVCISYVYMFVHIYMYVCVCIYQGHSPHSSEIIMKRGRKIIEAEELNHFDEHCFINTLGKLHVWTHDVGDNIQKTRVSSGDTKVQNRGRRRIEPLKDRTL